MHIKKTYLLFILFSVFLNLCVLNTTYSQSKEIQGTYIISKVSTHQLCLGEELVAYIEKGDNPKPPAPGALIIIQISNKDGNFDSFTNIGNSINSFTISCRIPFWLEPSNQYKIRMRSEIDAEDYFYVYPEPINIQAPPLIYTITGKTNVCEASSEIYQIDINKEKNAIWKVINGIISDSSANSITVKWNTNVKLGAVSIQSPSNSCGEAELTKLDVKINTISSCITSEEGVILRSNLISIHPNPASDILYISTYFEIKKSSIKNCNGQVLIETHSRDAIDLKHLSKGLYFLEVEGVNDQLKFYKFIKE
ncbi:MAG: T9SS C-terminal target domain-containing protein [Cytophagales bacterium]|nr:MAG: T9SS C-terminal target domain-containing protein [Cytophagales bacterium]